MRLQVLTATMNQKDFSLIEKMNISSDVVFANQCKVTGYEECTFQTWKAKMISTNTKGVGTNRNLALMYSDGDIILFADDDIVYMDDYSSKVIEAFEKNKGADALIFGLDMVKNGKREFLIRNKNKRLFFWNSLKYGACVLAARREFVEKWNIKFTELFGGGTLYSCGEDSLFILDLFRKGAKIYAVEYVLGTHVNDTSTWFTGYNEKFFYDKGAWIACAFPKSRHLIKWYFILRFRKKTELSLSNIHKYINSGIQGFHSLRKF